MVGAEGAATRPSALSVWIGVATGPIARTIHLIVCYLLVPYACASGNSWVFHLTTATTAGATAIAGFLAYRAWRQSGVGTEADASDWSRIERLTRRRGFMGSLGLFLSIVFFMLILAEAAGTMVLSPCQYRQYGGDSSYLVPENHVASGLVTRASAASRPTAYPLPRVTRRGRASTLHW